jgi:carboxymethylenebutenolidase
MSTRAFRFIPLLALVATFACTVQRVDPREHDHGATGSASGTLGTPQSAQARALPAGAADVRARLDASPRHGEWAMIKTGPTDSVKAWVVYPQRSTNAPVVVVIHEIFGLSTWIRGVADQLAADGFIAIAPDLLTGKVEHVQGDTATQQAATAAIRSLQTEDVQRQLAAVGAWGMARPAAAKKYGIVGFCWGGSRSFQHAIQSPTGLGASVVYYGGMTADDIAKLGQVKVPVLGLYGGNDQRVNATIPAVDSAMKALGKSYEPHIFDGAGHGFLRAQQDTARGNANLKATEQAWPLTVGWFKKHLGA